MRASSVETPDDPQGRPQMFDTLISLWMVAAAVQYILRFACVSAIKSESYPLYEKLGRPLAFSRHGWNFVFRASRQPQFTQLRALTRCGIRTMQVLNVLLIVLFAWSLWELFRSPAWRIFRF